MMETTPVLTVLRRRSFALVRAVGLERRQLGVLDRAALLRVRTDGVDAGDWYDAHLFRAVFPS